MLTLLGRRFRAGGWAAFLLLVPTVAGAQLSENVDLLGHLDTLSGYNDVWGYDAPDGTELAIVGTTAGTQFVDVTDPTAPREVKFVPGTTSGWRDIKTYRHYCYVVNEDGGGLQIIDLADPLDPTPVPATFGFFETCHNIFIDEPAGMLYAMDGRRDPGTKVIDISDPISPVRVATFTDFYIHDIYVRDGLAFAAAIYRGELVVLDVSALPAIEVLSQVPTDRAHTHNAWLTEDGKYCITTDETTSGHLNIFDVENPRAPRRVATWAPTNEPGAIVHNVTVRGNFAFCSWYTAGLEVIDVTDPTHPQRAGFYDTYVGGGGFNGAWGVYPFTASGNIFISDRSTGLYILAYTGEMATVDGSVVDSASRQPVAGVSVHSDEGSQTIVTGEDGSFQLRLSPGEHPIRCERFGYEPAETTVELEAREERTLEIGLRRIPTGTVRGAVSDLRDDAPVPEVELRLVDTPLVTQSASDGSFLFPEVPMGTYTLETERFGFHGGPRTVEVVPAQTISLDLPLVGPIFADDFETDTGWTVGAAGDDATAGIWERVDPVGTESGVPVQPEDDHSKLGDHAFVTGNGAPGAPAGDGDVDGGRTTLFSPRIDLAGRRPVLTYYRWYSNDRGANPGSDVFRTDVSSDGGETWINLETLPETRAFWERVEIDLTDRILPADQVQLRFVAEDAGGGSLVEAAIDDVEIFERLDRVSGIVRDGVTGQPVAGVAVEFLDSGERTTSGEDGRFRAAVYVGPERLRTEHFAYEAQEREIEVNGPTRVELSLVPKPPGSLEGIASPNPFGERTTLRFRLDRPETVRLEIFDAAGRRVRRLLGGPVPVGPHEIVWDGRDDSGRPVDSGIYFQRFETETRSAVGRLVRVR